MSTNIGGSALGNLILGASLSNVIERSVTSTLSFTQTISKTIEALEQTLTLSQTIEYSQVFSRTVTDTYTPTQTITVPVFFSVTSTYSPTQDIDEEHGKPRDLNQSVGLTQDVVSSHVAARLVVQGVNWTHTRGYNAVFVREVSQNLGLTQTIVGDHTRKVDSLLSLSHMISFEKLKHVQHHIELQQAIERLVTFNRSINTQYQPFHIITKTTKFNKTVSQTLNFSQSIVQARVKGVSQTLTLSQVVEGYAAKGVFNTISYVQSITYNHTNNRELEQTLNLEQTIGLVRSRTASVHHGFGLNSTVKQHREFNKTVSQSLNLTQEIRREVFPRTVAQTYSPSQTVGYTPVYPRTVGNTLNLGQSIVINRTINQSVSDTLVFLPFRQVYVGMGDVQYYNVENIQHALIRAYQTVKPHCVLQTNNAAITMPSPNWGDTEAYGGIFTIRRSMTGVPYTHVRTLSLRKLKLPWTVAKRKAWELREFLIQNNAKLITLTTWKGDKWFVNLISNPFELAVRGRYDVENEKVDIELEFEGLKVM